MKDIVLLLTLTLGVVLTSAATIWNHKDPHSMSSNILINRPAIDEFGYHDILHGMRDKRSSPLKPGLPQGVSLPLSNLKKGIAVGNEALLRKGEYKCGNKICRLQRGMKPCKDDLCQYPVL